MYLSNHRCANVRAKKRLKRKRNEDNEEDDEDEEDDVGYAFVTVLTVLIDTRCRLFGAILYVSVAS